MLTNDNVAALFVKFVLKYAKLNGLRAVLFGYSVNNA